MATIKIILRTSKINSAGEAPLCIRLIKNRVAKFVFLDYRIRPEQWDEKEKRVKKSHPNFTRINNYIAQKFAEAQAWAIDVESENKNANTGAIKQSIKGKASVEFFPYADRFVSLFELSGKIGSHGRAKSVIQKLREYVKGSRITFDQLTVSFLKEYEYYMQSELKNRVNTIHANMRVFRTIFNNAVREDLIPAEINPFNKMKLKTEQTQRAYLTEEELNRIDSLVLTESFMINHHRNIYVFSAYAGGLRISDVLQLRWNNFDGEKIRIKIHKTQTPLSIMLPERALQIINFYKRENSTGNDFISHCLKCVLMKKVLYIFTTLFQQPQHTRIKICRSLPNLPRLRNI